MSINITGTFLNEKNITNRVPQNNTVILSITDYQYIQMAHNWFLHIKKCGLENMSLLCCTDLYSYKYALKHNLPCFFVDITTLKLDNESYNKLLRANITDYSYQHLWKFLLIIDHLTKKYKFNIIYTDVDMVIIQNFIDTIVLAIQEGYETCIYINRNSKNIIDGNLFYYSQNIIQHLYKKIYALGFNNENKTNFMRFEVPDCFYLDENLFTTNSNWECIKIKNKCKIIHYNNTLSKLTIDLEKKLKSRYEVKKHLMKRDGFWILD